MNEKVQRKLQALPTSPGVYLMKNEAGKVIYVGKAINLKNRVRSYFNESGTGQSEKTRALVRHIHDLEWILTDSEMEALILECNLIKKYKPKYNIRLMDDKSYPYLQVTVQEDFPRVELVRSMKNDGARYFGPYTSSGAVNETLKLLRRIFPLRTCRSSAKWSTQERACLNAHINRCLAPCMGKVDKETYNQMIQEVILFLEGKQEALLKRIEEKMHAAAENLEFEKAAELRDQLLAIEKVVAKQKIVSDKRENYDVINYARGRKKVCVQVFYVREGKLLGRESFFLDGVQGDEDVLTPFIRQYYSRVQNIPPHIYVPARLSEEEDEEDLTEDSRLEERPAAKNSTSHEASTDHEKSSTPEEILAPATSVAPAEKVAHGGSITEEWLSRLRGGKVQIRVPKKGERKALLEMVGKNAQELLLINEQQKEVAGNWQAEGLEELKEILGMEDVPHRIECFDISHISGTETVASMVVSIDGQKRPDLYRRFKIRTVEGNNDFASMAEVMMRRFSKERLEDENFGSLPDLVVIDGGKGQLSSARAIMELMDVAYIKTVGLAERYDWIFLPNQSDPIILSHKSPGLRILQQIRDEAHRFAITYHRLLRGKRNLTSALDEIPGLGPKGKKALLQAFDLSLKNIMAASLEDLEKTPGLNKKSARAVFDWFHPQPLAGEILEDGVPGEQRSVEMVAEASAAAEFNATAESESDKDN